MADTNLAQAVEATHDSSSYDTNVKFLLADKQILSRILKYAVQEFKDMRIEDIMSSIGEDIEIGTKSLDAGLSNMGRINASGTEDNIPGEGKIFFDIRFTAYHNLHMYNACNKRYVFRIGYNRHKRIRACGYFLFSRAQYRGRAGKRGKSR